MNILASNFDPRIRLLYAVALIALAAIFLPASPVSAQESSTAPGAPVGLVLALGNARLVAGWNPPENDGGAEITAYEVQYKTTGATNLASVLDDPAAGWVDAGHSGTGTDTEITGLTNGVTYDVRVRASNSKGDGQWSDTASAAPHEDVIWSAILTVDVDNDYGDGIGTFGCVIDVLNSDMDECPVALTDDEFSFGLDDYGWTQFSRTALPDEPPNYTKVGLSALVPDDSNLREGKIQIGSEVVALDNASRVQWFIPDPDTYPNMQWIFSGFLLRDDASNGTYDWTEGQRVPLSLQARLPQVQAVTGEIPPGSSGSIPDATLSALTVSDGTNDVPLTPAFASDTTGYTASVDNSVGGVTVTPTVSDPNAEVTVEGSTVTSGTASSPIALTAGTPKAISVVVTAQDGTANTYTVTVTRAFAKALALPVVSTVSSDATLMALAVSDGTNDVPLTPEFDSDTAGYTASVDNSVGSVTVTVTVNDANAAVTVEGSTVTSGTVSSPIALTAGTPKAISVVVTAQDGTANTYTVTVTRENEDANTSRQYRGPDDDEARIIETCRQRYAGNVEGLRVCQLGYEGVEAIMMLTLPGPAPANGTTVTLATSTNQTATGDDYTMPSTITIYEGETSGLITITITDDDEDEGDETIHIFVCIRPGCDPLNLVDGEKHYNHGIVIPGTRGYGGL